MAAAAEPRRVGVRGELGPAVAYRVLRKALEAAPVESALKDAWARGTLLFHLGRCPAARRNVLECWDGQTVFVRREPGKRHKHFAFWQTGEGWSDPVYVSALLRPRRGAPQPPWAVPPPPRPAARPWSRGAHGAMPEGFKKATVAFLIVARRFGLNADVTERVVALAAPPPVCPINDRFRLRALRGLGPLPTPTEAEDWSSEEDEGGPENWSLEKRQRRFARIRFGGFAKKQQQEGAAAEAAL